MRTLKALLVSILCCCPAALAATYSIRTVPLPGGGEAGIGMDYIAYNPATHSIWVPAGNTGAVDVIDAVHNTTKQLAGFPTAEVQMRDRKRVIGPSAVTIGKGTVYIGNRANANICAVDEKTLAKGRCVELNSPPDGLAYVGRTNEVWVTTPRDKSLRVLDGTTLAEKARIVVAGEPEGFAVDEKSGRFYTNLEDMDRTLAIDVRTHKTIDDWKASCGEKGPRGLSIDEQRKLLFVACTDRVESLDLAHDGHVISSIETGDGVDGIDYSPQSHMLYAGASRAGKFTVMQADAKGRLTATATVTTPNGTRNGVLDVDGNVYLTHSAGSELVVVSPRK